MRAGTTSPPVSVSDARDQSDGNPAVRGPDDTAARQPGTAAHSGAGLAVQDDGTVVLYGEGGDGGRPLRTTDTAASAPAPPASGLTPGVAGFHAAWPGEAPAVGGDLGPHPLAPVAAYIGQGGLFTADRSLDEVRCRHGGRRRVRRALVRQLAAARNGYVELPDL